MKHRYVVCVFATLLNLHCSPPNPEKRALRQQAASMTGETAPSAGSATGVVAIKKPDSVFDQKIDASSLRVWDITIANQRVATKNNKQIISNVAFTSDGKAEHIEYQICPLDGEADNLECVDGTTIYYRVRLYNIFSGKVIFKARACVDKERALSNSNCGPWQERTYEVPVFNKQLATINQEIIKTTRDLRRLGLDYHQALSDYVTEANACVLTNSEVEATFRSKVRVVEQFIRTPVAWFGQSAEDLAHLALGEEISDRIVDRVGTIKEEITNKLNESCENLGEMVDKRLCIAVKTMVQFPFGMITGLNPISAVSAVSTHIHNIYYGTFKGETEKLVAMNCLAEQKLQNTSSIIGKQMEEKIARLKELKKERDE